jgi:hypothetical protein
MANHVACIREKRNAKARRKETIRKTQTKWENNIKLHLRE